MKSTLLKGEPQNARCATTFPDHLVKFQWDGVVDLAEDDTVHPYPPRIIGRSFVHDVVDEGITLKCLLHEVMLAGVVGGGGVKDDVHQPTDIEDHNRLKVESGDNRVFIGWRGSGE
jgi:hypothetical protein